MKTILVTGGAGFIGSNFVRYFLDAHPDLHVVNFDKLTYAGNLENLTEVQNHSQYSFVRGDICDRAHVDSAFQRFSIDTAMLIPNFMSSISTN